MLSNRNRLSIINKGTIYNNTHSQDSLNNSRALCTRGYRSFLFFASTTYNIKK